MIGIATIILGVLILITKGSLQSLLHIRFTTGDLLMLIASFFFASYTILVRLKPKEYLQSSQFFCFRSSFSPVYLWEHLLSALFLTLLHFATAYVGSSLVSYYLWNEAITLIGTQNGLDLLFNPRF
jgi:drug/metabolite transporter (DMT)-like permease